MPELTLVEAIATPHQGASVAAMSFEDTERRLSFHALFDTTLSAFDPDGLVHYGDWQRLEAEYRNVLAQPPFIMSGMLHFDNYSFLENDALPVDPRRHEALIGQPLGWGRDYADWYVNDHRLGKVIDGKSNGNGLKALIRNPGQRPLPRAILLSSPGHDIYGHWLIDMLPRLTMLNHLFVEDVPLLLNFVPPWARYFLEAVGVDPRRIRPHPRRCFSVETAMVPTMCKAGQSLAPRLLRESWDLVLAHHRRRPATMVTAAKVFVSRSRWGLRERESSDRDEIDQIMERRGYRVVHPQDLTIGEQIALMQSARIVIGEDGSALHNIAFCQPGATLGVLSTPERDNLYHYGICQIRGHRLGYCPIPQSLTGLALEKGLGDFIDALESKADI